MLVFPGQITSYFRRLHLLLHEFGCLSAANDAAGEGVLQYDFCPRTDMDADFISIPLAIIQAGADRLPL